MFFLFSMPHPGINKGFSFCYHLQDCSLSVHMLSLFICTRAVERIHKGLSFLMFNWFCPINNQLNLSLSVVFKNCQQGEPVEKTSFLWTNQLYSIVFFIAINIRQNIVSPTHLISCTFCFLFISVSAVKICIHKNTSSKSKRWTKVF